MILRFHTNYFANQTSRLGIVNLTHFPIWHLSAILKVNKYFDFCLQTFYCAMLCSLRRTRCLTSSEIRRMADSFKQLLKTILFSLY